MPGAAEPTHQQLTKELQLVRRAGLAKLRTLLPDLHGLSVISREVYGDDTPASVEQLLRDAWRQLGNGPHGKIIGVLFGLAQGHRGGMPAALREKAATMAGYATVETFRKKPQTEAIEDLADQVISIRAQKMVRPEASDDRVAAIVAQIEKLTSLELAELARVLNHRLGPVPG